MTMSFQSPTIRFERLKEDIESLGRIGRHEDRGIYRMAFSDEDMEGRRWLQSRITEAGLSSYVDPAANVHARHNWHEHEPSVIMGSHIDTVRSGGRLDGALGVLTGLEILRRIKEENIETKYPVETIAFTDEEGRFGGLFGSQALVGDLTPEIIHRCVDVDGISIEKAMATHGLNAHDALLARRNPKSIHAYMEMHIEQGPVLDSLAIPIGLVSAITGLFKWNIRLMGEANHAGTTPMHMRRDAFQGVAEFSREIPRILEENGSEHSVGTIGSISLYPGSPNVVPAKAEFTLDIRDPDPEVLDRLKEAMRNTLSAIGRRRGLMFEFDVLSDIAPAVCDSGIMKMAFESARETGMEFQSMISGSVHDALIISRIAPMGMIFVPSKDGKSHSPEEWTAYEDIEMGANLLLRTILKIAEVKSN